MALYDIAKTGKDRTKTTLNSPDTIINTQRMAFNTTTINPAKPNDAITPSLNIRKIIAHGEISLLPRNANITLTGTTIGYSFQVEIMMNDILQQTAVKYPMVAIYTNSRPLRRDIKYAGLLYFDDTNEAVCNFDYYITYQSVVITFNIRVKAGTYTFNPSELFAIPIYWEVTNGEFAYSPGGGATVGGDGKYYYLDTITYDRLGNIISPLSSSLEQFAIGRSAYFPYMIDRGVIVV